MTVRELRNKVRAHAGLPPLPRLPLWRRHVFVPWEGLVIARSVAAKFPALMKCAGWSAGELADRCERFGEKMDEVLP